MKQTAPIPFAGSALAESRHVCAFFNGDEEFYRVLMPFIKDGFACGDRAVHVVGPGQHAAHRGETVIVFVPPQEFLPELRERRPRQIRAC